jgi:hypothetical protein
LQGAGVGAFGVAAVELDLIQLLAQVTMAAPSSVISLRACTASPLAVL